jgi:hemerythrin-like metal-binding protein
MPHRFGNDDRYRLGHPAIDQDHAAIFRLSDQMAAAVEKNNTRVCPQLLLEIIDRMKEHFEREIRILEYRRYPNVADHGGHHRLIIEELNQLAHTCRADCDRDRSATCHQRVTDAIIEEVVESDLQFSGHLKE